MAYAFLVMMTFSFGSGEKTEWNLPCPDMACVADVLAHTGESRTLARLRVYKGPVGIDSVSGVPTGAPLLDLWFQ